MKKTKKVIIFLVVLFLPLLLYILFLFLSLTGVADAVVDSITGKHKVRTVNIVGEYGDEFIDKYTFVDAENDALGGGAYEHSIYFENKKICTITTNAENRGKQIILKGVCFDEVYTIYKIGYSDFIYRSFGEKEFHVLKYPIFLSDEIEISKSEVYCHMIKYGDFDLAKFMLNKDIYSAKALIESFVSGDLSQYRDNISSEEEMNLIIDKSKQLLKDAY